jgi:outer membrane protein OmpA-like peptidoglycan-associated protein
VIAKSNENAQNASNDNLYSDKIEIDKNSEKVIIPEEQTSTEIEEIEINLKSDDITGNHTADNDQAIPVESKNSAENTKDALSENIIENETQTDSKNNEIITPIDPVDYEIAKFNENTESKSETPEIDLQGKTTNENIKLRRIDSTKASVKEIDHKFTADSGDQFFTFAEQKFYIFYKQNSTDLDNQAFEQLDNIVENVSKNIDSDIVIEGYADSYGDKDFNKKLSIFRANIVEGYFVAKGVHSSRLKVVGLGSDSPIGDNSTKEGRQKNRRVEIKIFTKSYKDPLI